MRRILWASIFVYSTAIAADTPEIAAEAFCECNRPANTKAEEMMEAFSIGDTGLLLELDDEMKYLNKLGDACRNKLRKKYADKPDSFARFVNYEIERRCPEPRWEGGMPTMGGVGGDSRPSGESLDEFMRQQGAPDRQ